MQGAPLVMLHASTLVFAFRALWTVRGMPQERAIERQIVDIVRELTGARDGAVTFDSEPDQGSGKLRLRVPVRVYDEPQAVLAFDFDDSSALAEGRETLTAIANLATVALEHAREAERLRDENALLRARLDENTGIVGSSPAIERLKQMITRVAARDTTILILGESGVGKELVARAIHQQSPRGNGPFAALNCAAITDTLLESELFGYEKGAFTGAAAQKMGRLEAAAGGTVFFDEVGELAPSLQAKLLRALQEREIVRVGGTQHVKLDVRVIAATNRDLAAEVKKGAFREDLYHRLNVVALRTPPLRERPEDIPVLARHFLARSAEQCKRRVTGLSPEAERCLIEYSWPGNVRELENAMERAVVLGSTPEILIEDLPESILDAAALAEIPGAYQRSVIDAKRESIIAAYRQAGGDYKGAAKLLGVHPNYLLRLIRNLGLKEAVKQATG
jgi:Nif-specific regulatory protein